MAWWKIEFTPNAAKSLSKIDRSAARRIIRYLRERLENCEDPRSHGKALKGVLREFWRYRVGEYRIIARIEDNQLLILVVRIAHHREVYNK